MKKLISLLLCLLVCATAMCHIVMKIYQTDTDGIPYYTLYYLDDIERIELFSNSDDEEHLGENGIKIYKKNYSNSSYFSSELDSVVWEDYVSPGLSTWELTAITSEETAKERVAAIYKYMNCFSSSDNNYGGDWGFKPQILTNSHPTLDTQATGWDKDWNTQSYDEESEELTASLWNYSYYSIFQCNKAISDLMSASCIDGKSKEQLVAEVRTIRAFFYIQLASSFGRVMIFDTGEDHDTVGTKRARAASYADMWDYIIGDLKAAADVLDWKPRETTRTYGRNGTMNKGIALAYLGDAYMWKAYRCPDAAQECYKLAADALEKVVKSGEYELNESFTTLWDAIPENAEYKWNKEAILVQILENAEWESEKPYSFMKFHTACPGNGGWGSLYLSWEWYTSFEMGDKRRDASCVTGNIPDGYMEKFGIGYSAINRGYHPYLKEPIYGDDYNHFNCGGALSAPSIWSMKYWRNASTFNNAWSVNMHAAANIYWKRLPNVMLDYAECLFNLGYEKEGWDIVNKLRNRAFGNLEVGKADELTGKYLPELNRLYRAYSMQHDTYPIPFNEKTVEVADAKTYYTALKAEKGFSSPAWKVAVNEERRKEFNSEPCLRPDMERSGYLEDHIEHNYPKRAINSNERQDTPWTERTFDFNPQRMTFPIPLEELRRNSECDQNEGY